ncbi:MAG: hypothetical protein A2487_02775 [Candidatus Raymondbacteria bacterium RifOxyC12_full_50_8]|uniref:dTDP-4-dehydrorhamnose reductase n=1 Tax=Candidatus Raymondbacteria bacterium RIFOXYD12_FULL_49_13 TaxID=1817890 RepID=A0A1F7F6J9_UNCRA|nr:MAG: hypothetical protein A2350_06985 [Candidatus Raymondbacteria bacterium RifOxyB12_full_50_8]OGJ93183.1 MAG: hypothetical protein A2248_17580 [Candidatus Raymondbacteria bacterium RIFOXYA2_FULL_49_16]OGJ93368.1 MAG: hypothetical protein A2487_02775 [Candidatus Raymondbacteria bacterium RifOxyC12_full_50_8]OGK02290.1 MAG: hypothetical protein A2519_16605 [Candidatus Raymondbacteria bacterium RIFOXYD12_FULL_49_13]OGP44905.1 MAG: hypothetical protein A2324_19505 [Candidatus Raymondbacteria b
MKRVLITGVNGLLGQNLQRALAGTHSLSGVDLQPEAYLPGLNEYATLDITDRTQVAEFFKKRRFDWIVNTAAMTNVDLCETERERAERINTGGVAALISEKGAACRFMQISTDYVFDGAAGPYSDTAKPNPVGFYGETKYRAEQLVLGHSPLDCVVRIMVLYGTGKGLRPNFIDWVVSSLRAGKTIPVVTDQTGNITLASNCARNIGALINNDVSGIISFAGADILSRYDIACAVARHFSLNEALIRPIATAELKQAAPRPLKSGFLMERARAMDGITLLTFKEQLLRYEREQKDADYPANV